MSKTAAEIRREFVEFFCRKHDHTHVPGAPVIPYDDPTLLFTNAGMNQFKPLFLGTADRGSEFGRLKRAANSQPCIRAGGKHNDLDDVGHDTYHHTFFEMLGNWSFGDYFKKEAIEWAWELITKVWGIDASRIHATYFGGDPAEGLEPDLEARELWCSVPGMSPERVHPGNKKDNFWEMGDTGPCGPCSEMHIDLTPDKSGGPLVNAGDERVIEFWNLVFIQFNRGPDGKLSPLPAKHVDTGMGFERITRIVQGKRSNYDIDVFTPIFAAIQRVSGAAAYGGRMDAGEQSNKGTKEQGADHAAFMRDVAYRVIADHIRTLTFAISDGCPPDKDGRGFVLRRILRRAVRYGWQYLGLKKPFLCELVPTVVEVMGDSFPRLRGPKNSGSIGVSPVRANESALATLELPAPPSMSPERVAEIIRDEEHAFARTLDRGIALFEDAAQRAESDTQPSRARKEAGSSADVRDVPAAYFLTFHTYGTWLHGRDEGSIDDQMNAPGDPVVAPNRGIEQYEREALTGPPMVFDEPQRAVVENTIREVAAHRGWQIHALHVRTNHLHVVVSGETKPERMMNDFKSYATRKLREARLAGSDASVWSRHGSTRYLWQEASIVAACAYVLEGQGDPMGGASRGGEVNPLPYGRGSENQNPLPHGGGSENQNPLPYGRGSENQNPLPHGRGSDGSGEFAQPSRARKEAGSRSPGVISGADAFKLHDTFGFPIDLTEIMAQERGLRVDIGEYERLMEEARVKARGGSRSGIAFGQTVKHEQVPAATNDDKKYVAREFTSQCRGKFSTETFLDQAPAASGEECALIFRDSCFYSEQGGQVGDSGTITTDTGTFEVSDTKKVNGVVLHIGKVRSGRISPDQDARLTVGSSRESTQRNHTATHILNLALRNTLGNHIDQKGSLVDPEKTRFDFSHPKPISPDEVTKIEAMVTKQIKDDLIVDTNDNVPVDQAAARKINTLRAVFGEKYPDKVRVVAIGAKVADLLNNPSNPEWMNYSVEFCGGTHVKRTSEIGEFAIVAEEAVAKGIRRVVGVTGEKAREAIENGRRMLAELEKARRLADTSGGVGGDGTAPAGSGAVAGGEVLSASVAALQKAIIELPMRVVDRQAIRDGIANLQELSKKQQKQAAAASADALKDQIPGLITGATRKGDTTVIVAELPDSPIDAIKTACDTLKQKCGSTAILLGTRSEKATLLAAVTDDLIKKGIKAGDWIKAVAPIVEGGGGGPPTMAQAGGKNPAKLGEALEAGKAWVLGKL